MKLCALLRRETTLAVAAAPSKTHDLRSADAAEVILSGSEHSLAVQQSGTVTCSTGSPWLLGASATTLQTARQLCMGVGLNEI